MRFDAVIIGGGLIGGACADALAGEGLKVCLLDAGRPAREASWAGAGILHPIHPWQYPGPLQDLLRAGVAKHQATAADLLERTGIDVEWDRTGLLVMGSEIGRLESWCAAGGAASSGARRVEARSKDPAIRVDGPALWLPEAASVKNQRLARAFLEGARRRGAEFRFGTPATRISDDGVDTPSGPIHADKIIVAAGAWAAKLLPELAVEPVRGQILLYESRLRHMVIFPDGEYAVPRRDGRTLFGSTLEKAGFDARPRPEAVRDLSRRATALLGLGSDRLLAAWAGLRPGTPHLRPYIGMHPNRENVVLACGHYRNGILLAPLTGEIVRDLVLGRNPRFSLDPFGL